MPVLNGFIHGTGAALNVSIGFVPDVVEITDLTNGTIITKGVMFEVVAFTSGSLEIFAGDTITGLTNTGVSGVVDQVILDSGSWAGGDAAGWLVFKAAAVNGTFGSENAEVNDSGDNDLTVAAEVQKGVNIDTEVASATTTAGVQAYYGDADNGYPAGFTVGSGVSVNGALLFFQASASDPLYTEPTVAGVTQQAGVW